MFRNVVSNLGLQANSDIEITKEDKNGIEVRGGNPCFIAYTVRVCVYVCGEGGGFGCLQITKEDKNGIEVQFFEALCQWYESYLAGKYVVCVCVRERELDTDLLLVRCSKREQHLRWS